MRKGTKIILIIGLCILGAGLILGILAFALTGFNWRQGLPGAAKAEEQYVNQIIEEDFSNVQIEAVTCNVKVKKAEDGKNRLEYTYTKLPDEPDYELKTEGGTLIFRQMKEEKEQSWFNPAKIWEQLKNWISGSSFMNGGELTLYLAEKPFDKLNLSVVTGNIITDKTLSFKSVNIATTTGNISIPGMATGLESLNIAATTGDIEVSEINIPSALAISVVTGDVQLGKVSAGGNSSITSTTGDIRISDSEFDSINIATTSGHIQLNTVMAETLSAETVSGSVTGTVSPELNVKAETTTGDISVPNGNKGNWTITTVSGDIILE